MKLIFSAFALLLLTLAPVNLIGDSNLCTGAKSCKCNSGEVVMPETYATPGRGKTKKMYSCMPGLDPSKFLQCISKLTLAEQDCGGCGEKTKCIKSSGQIPLALQPGMVAPKNCKYLWEGFSISTYRKVVATYKADENTIKCTHSMCTSAVFLAWINIQRNELREGRISKKEFNARTKPGGTAYQILNGAAEPNKLVQKYGLGKSVVQYRVDGKIGRTRNMPKIGDLVQLWRNNGGGHSVVFKGFRDANGDGKNDQICYWSSQKKTNGYGNRCENIRSMDRILIGSLNG